MDLEQANLFYRHPAWYDQVQDDPDHAVATLCEDLIDTHAPAARTLLDLGCGTARDLAHLATRFECVGVDCQPRMIAHASATHPNLDLRVGDLRDFRLGHTVDVITCLGNSLSYLHADPELQAAFRTFAAHAHGDTLLIVYTPIAPVAQTEIRTNRVDTDDLHATVSIRYEWDLFSQVNTMHRVWAFDDGTEAHDRIRRRVLFPRELDLRLALAGFRLVGLFDDPSDPDDRTRQLTGPSAYLVARGSTS